MTAKTQSIAVGKIRLEKTIRFAIALVIYLTFALSLYSPHFRSFERTDYLIILNGILASSGCYLLSSRWISSFWAKLFAGCLYGFGPFMIGLVKFHPAVGMLAGLIPWAFLPAAFCPIKRWKFLPWLLSVIPFLMIVTFFNLAALLGFFPASIQCRLQASDLILLFAPVVASDTNSILVGFYHVPVAPLVIGISMLLISRRRGIMIMFMLGLVGAVVPSMINVSPLLWLTIPSLCLAVLVGEGTQGLARAGFTDRRWVFLSMVIMGLLAMSALFFATTYFQEFAGLGDKYAKALAQAAKMYLVGAIAVAVILFMVRAKIRLCWLRLAILCSAMGIDIYINSQLLVDKTL